MILMTGVATEEQAKAEDARPLGLYVHVPFCATTCDFCAFYQVPPTAESIGGFIKSLSAEAGLVDWDRPLSTVFWGGGTPGLLSPADLGRVASLVRSLPGGSSPREWTVELAPASVTPERLAVLRDAGVTRVSLGVQSFRPELLDALGRAHSREQVYRAYDRIRGAGFTSVNVDLMFALPGQTAARVGRRHRRGRRARARPHLDLLPHLRGGHRPLGEAVPGPRAPRPGERGADVRAHLGAPRGRGLRPVRGLQLRPARARLRPQRRHLAHGRVGRARAVGRFAAGGVEGLQHREPAGVVRARGARRARHRGALGPRRRPSSRRTPSSSGCA